jgi:hypothetical protein
MSLDPTKLTGGDTTLAQAVYLANLFAQKGTCNCTACQLLRKSTEGMIAQVLGGLGGGPQVGLDEAARQILKTPPVTELDGQEGQA